jgi:gamma-glutamylcyclotransferase (GGCT)/AIG2-like uncharacterized protein YtfP
MGLEWDRTELETTLAHLNRDRGPGVGTELAPDLDDALDRPAHALVVYGTLAPGRENHHLLTPLAGEWSEVTIEGELGEWIGYPMFRWVTPGARVPAWLLRSADLPAHYARLDEFETAAYARHLVPYDGDTGLGVANCYVESPTRD